MNIEVEVANFEKRINRILDKVPAQYEWSVQRSGLPAGAKVVQEAMVEEAPDSRRPTAKSPKGSRAKWSSKTRAARQGKKQLKQSIGYKVSKREANWNSAMVGPKRPDGNVAHFVAPLQSQEREVVLWGRRTGTTTRKDDQFLKRTFDRTKVTALRAIVRGTVKAARNRLRELAREAM